MFLADREVLDGQFRECALDESIIKIDPRTGGFQ
jgi:hypothetical protein